MSVKYFINIMWLNGSVTQRDDMTYGEIIEYLTGIHDTAMNEQIYQVKFYPVIVNTVRTTDNKDNTVNTTEVTTQIPHRN